MEVVVVIRALIRAPLKHSLPLVFTLFLLNTPAIRAELVDADQYQATSRQKLIQRFLEFTGDKNVMGKARTGEGKVVLFGSKNRFDKDDGLSYRSDLTYHDLPQSIEDKTAQKKDPRSTRKLPEWVSEHGGLSEAGGSSKLERVVYQEHEEYSKKDEAARGVLSPQQQEDQKKGITYRSIYKTEVKEIFDGSPQTIGGTPAPSPTQAPNPSGTPNARKEEVSRTELRPEVAKKVATVGEESFQSIDEAAKDNESKNDPNALGNPILFYEAGARAVEAWFNSTTANLSQRRMAESVKGNLIKSVQLNEGTPSCEAWAKEDQSQAARSGLSPAAQKIRLEELQKVMQKCQQMSKAKFSEVYPRFEPPKPGSPPNTPEQLKAEGPKKEDQYERDLRNQAEVLQKAGISLSKLPSNWKYTEKDEQSTYSRFDDSGQKTGEDQVKLPQVFDEYNQQIDSAIQGFKDVKTVYPEVKFDEEQMKSYQLVPEKESAKDIMLRPVQQELEDQAQITPQQSEDPQNYEELLQKAQQ